MIDKDENIKTDSDNEPLDKPDNIEEFNETEEQDLDETVHHVQPLNNNADEERDVDDMIHTAPNNPVSEEEAEQNPDDLVHGN